jgi:hypothetical protein
VAIPYVQRNLSDTESRRCQEKGSVETLTTIQALPIAVLKEAFEAKRNYRKIHRRQVKQPEQGKNTEKCFQVWNSVCDGKLCCHAAAFDEDDAGHSRLMVG